MGGKLRSERAVKKHSFSPPGMLKKAVLRMKNSLELCFRGEQGEGVTVATGVVKGKP